MQSTFKHSNIQSTNSFISCVDWCRRRSYLDWSLNIIIRLSGLRLGSRSGSVSESVGHVVQGGLQRLNMMHQLHAQLLSPLLQPPSTFTLLHIALLIQTSSLSFILEDAGASSVKVD